MSLNIEQVLIIGGGPQVPCRVLGSHLARRTPWAAENPAAGDQIVACYTAYGQLSGISNLIAFAQACHETAHFTSGWWLNHNNPAGIGVTGEKGKGNRFATPAEGILAQFAHLLAYAAVDGVLTLTQQRLLPFTPRLQLLINGGRRGTADRWVDLGGKWAPSPDYGRKVLAVAEQIAAAFRG